MTKSNLLVSNFLPEVVVAGMLWKITQESIAKYLNTIPELITLQNLATLVVLLIRTRPFDGAGSPNAAEIVLFENKVNIATSVQLFLIE